MKPITLPAFLEGTKSGYKTVLDFLTRSFLARRASAVHKAAFFSDLADACSELADHWRKRAYIDAVSDGDLAPYTRLRSDGTPLDPKLFGKEFVHHGLFCQVQYTRLNATRRLTADPEFLATEEGAEIAEALESVAQQSQHLDDLREHLDLLCKSYVHTHNLPEVTCKPSGSLKVLDK